MNYHSFIHSFIHSSNGVVTLHSYLQYISWMKHLSIQYAYLPILNVRYAKCYFKVLYNNNNIVCTRIDPISHGMQFNSPPKKYQQLLPSHVLRRRMVIPLTQLLLLYPPSTASSLSYLLHRRRPEDCYPSPGIEPRSIKNKSRHNNWAIISRFTAGNTMECDRRYITIHEVPRKQHLYWLYSCQYINRITIFILTPSSVRVKTSSIRVSFNSFRDSNARGKMRYCHGKFFLSLFVYSTRLSVYTDVWTK